MIFIITTYVIQINITTNANFSEMFEIPRCEKIDMPIIGFGTWQIPASDAERVVNEALEVGYNHIDCAEIYRNEAEIGKCFEKLQNRKDIYITSKLWSADHEPHRVSKGLDQTLRNLKLDYLDMYLIHNPMRFDDSFSSLWIKKEWIVETWREMVKLKDSGKTKRIGVSNLSTTKLKWILDEDEKPSNNQVELHPYLPQHKLIKFCKENDIVLTGYSTIGTPATTKFMPGMVDDDSPILLQDKCIAEVARKISATPAQVLIKWGLLRGYPVLVKSSSISRMKENLEALKVEIPPAELEKINKINIKCRYCNFKTFIPKDHSVDEFFDGETYN